MVIFLFKAALELKTIPCDSDKSCNVTKLAAVADVLTAASLTMELELVKNALIGSGG